MFDKLGNYLIELIRKDPLRSVTNRINGKINHSYISDLEKVVSRHGNKLTHIRNIKNYVRCL